MATAGIMSLRDANPLTQPGLFILLQVHTRDCGWTLGVSYGHAEKILLGKNPRTQQMNWFDVDHRAMMGKKDTQSVQQKWILQCCV